MKKWTTTDADFYDRLEKSQTVDDLMLLWEEAKLGGYADFVRMSISKQKAIITGRQMSKEDSYQKLIRDFNHSGGRNPKDTEIEAWETGYDSGVKDAYKDDEEGH